ncbi:MAG TPA: G1 family glutamic endopeptidase, partial [Acidimicrobiales bacterium]|nr:G1 family glutamic endopeptidase [Acidimicrobiales bacterium]
VPSLESGDLSGSMTAAWVGVGGFNQSDPTLIQAGVVAQPDASAPGGADYQAWWELLPDPATTITSMTVGPGDSVTVLIRQVSGTTWSITVTDTTRAETFSTQQTYGGPTGDGTGASAEWIVERPEVGGTIVPLAGFAPAIQFSGLAVAGPDDSVTEAEMVENGAVVAQPGSLGAGGFSVASNV